MNTLTFGAGLNTHGNAQETLETARVAEQVGFDVGWISDSHLLGRELFTVFGAIAVSTSRMQIGSGVTHPFVRHFSLLASGFATLQDLAPGRIRLGIGVGDSGPGEHGAATRVAARARGLDSADSGAVVGRGGPRRGRLTPSGRGAGNAHSRCTSPRHPTARTP